MTQPIYEFGGAGPIVHMAVANGFPPQVYRPLVWPMTGQALVVSLPPRALWPGEQPPSRPLNWKHSVAQDLIQGMETYDLRDVVAIGHSFGAVATLLAAAAQPARFKAVILLDPTILPLAIMRLYRLNVALTRLGFKGRNPLAERAAKRRDRFESIDSAYETFRTRRLFADWPDETVRLYAESLLPTPEGYYTLAWPKAWEAYYFRTLYTGTWGDLPRLRGKMPILVLRGAQSDTFLPEAAERLRRLLPQAHYAEISGHGHLFPQSAPHETRKVITDWLATL